MKIGQTSLTERQMKIFQTLKHLNWAGIQTLHDTQCAAILKNSRSLLKAATYWVDREKIFEDD